MNNKEDLEKIMERVTGKPAPPGLKERVLDGLEREASARRIMTPLLRAALAGCCLLLLFFILADRKISGAEQNCLNSLLGLPAAGTVFKGEAIDEEMAKYWAEFPDLDRTSCLWLRQALLAEKRAASAWQPEAILREAMNEN